MSVEATAPELTSGAEPDRADGPTGSAGSGAERRRERLAYWGYRVAEAALQRLPRRALMAASEAAASGVFAIAAEKRALTRENLARPLGLPSSHPRVRQAAIRAFRNYGKYLVDMFRLGSLTDDEVDRLVHLENVEILKRAVAEGRGVIVCCLHYGAMDMIGPALKPHGARLNVVADDTSYGRLFEHLREIRRRHAIHLVPWRNLRGLFRALRDREALVLFCDWGFRRGDVPVEFFGEPTTFPAGPATLSARSGAPILPVDVRRTTRDTFVARGLPLLRAKGDDPAQIQRVTQQLADSLATVVAADPGQWYIFRRIWPDNDADRAYAARALAAARRGEDWTRLRAA